MNLNFLFTWNTNERKPSIFLASKLLLLGFDIEYFFSSWVIPKCTFCQPFFSEAKETSTPIRLKYGSMGKKNQTHLFLISLFLACETLAQEKTFVYLCFPRQLNALSSAILYVSTCYFAYYFSSGLCWEHRGAWSLTCWSTNSRFLCVCAQNWTLEEKNAETSAE